jgi:hypothetical protein
VSWYYGIRNSLNNLLSHADRSWNPGRLRLFNLLMDRLKKYIAGKRKKIKLKRKKGNMTKIKVASDLIGTVQ